jgi:hypothetical protein
MKSLLIIVLSIVSILFGDPLTTEKNEKAFADYLFNQQLYKESAKEYLRLLFRKENIVPKDSILILAAEAYALAGDTVNAVNTIDSAISVTSDSLFKNKLIITAARLCLLSGKDSACYDRITSKMLPSLSSEAYALFVACSLTNPQIIKPVTLPPILPINRRDTLIMFKTENWKQQFHTATPKSPLLSGILSTLIPGAGQTYSDNFRDGIAAISLIGICAYQSWVGFNDNGMESWKGWGFGIVGTAFYGGNIYGAIQSSTRTNALRKETFFRGIRLTINEQF